MQCVCASRRSPLTVPALVASIASFVVIPVVGSVVGLVLALRARRVDDRRGLLLAARVIAVLNLTLAAAAVALSAAGVVPARGDVRAITSLVDGECFDVTEARYAVEVEVLPCDGDHQFRVFARLAHPAGPADPYPGERALAGEAAASCRAEAPGGAATLRLYPTERGWHEDGDRVVTCAVEER